MALTETTEVDKCEVLSNGIIQARTAQVIKRDGVEISRSLHRHVVHPGMDTSSQSAEVQAICAAVHTAEIIAAYQASQAEAPTP